ncbi:MAG: hypothetical protein FWD68_19995 [Alphaproteobacteria bacterium]|nr:hypothetical protein [Alphaproteobacteria bacterium]
MQPLADGEKVHCRSGFDMLLQFVIKPATTGPRRPVAEYAGREKEGLPSVEFLPVLERNHRLDPEMIEIIKAVEEHVLGRYLEPSPAFASISGGVLSGNWTLPRKKASLLNTIKSRVKSAS